MISLYRLLSNISKGCYIKPKPTTNKKFKNTVIGIPLYLYKKKKYTNKNEQYTEKKLK